MNHHYDIIIIGTGAGGGTIARALAETDASTLIVERGVSFVAFDDRGAAIRTAYASNIYAPQARYLIGEETVRLKPDTTDKR